MAIGIQVDERETLKATKHDREDKKKNAGLV
jgi:hypothetical protein